MITVYEHDDDVHALIRSFEDAKIARDDWKHAEHLVVALYYVTHYDIETAIEKMRHGILRLLKEGFKVELEKEMPYHETMTVFWIHTVAAFNKSNTDGSLLDKANELVTLYDKDYPLRFYSRELLFSNKARAGFVDGDL